MNLKKSITAESIMPITGMGKIARGGVGAKPGAGSTSPWALLNPSKDMKTLERCMGTLLAEFQMPKMTPREYLLVVIAEDISSQASSQTSTAFRIY